VRRLAAVPEPVAGDFTNDGELSIEDVDLLSEAIAAQSHEADLDVTGDSLVTLDDLDRWVVELKMTWFGDANLDGEFNSTDLVQVFQRGQYEDDVEGNSTWDTGDWNADTEFNTTDMVVAFQEGGYERGLRAAVRTVPEPSAALAFATAAIVMINLRRRRSHVDERPVAAAQEWTRQPAGCSIHSR
jgi:hypothetical protein